MKKLFILAILALVTTPAFAQSVHGESVQDESVDTAWVRGCFWQCLCDRNKFWQ
jgi:uncharacterized protein YdeI (BOF family)